MRFVDINILIYSFDREPGERLIQNCLRFRIQDYGVVVVVNPFLATGAALAYGRARHRNRLKIDTCPRGVR